MNDDFFWSKMMADLIGHEKLVDDSVELPHLRFRGSEYVLVGDKENGGAIATVEQYSTGECSFAHLYEDGSIKQFGEIIGTIDDIEWISNDPN